MSPLIVFIIIIIIIALIAVGMNGIYIINEYERGIVLFLGKAREALLQPGFNFVIPLLNRVIKMDMRTETLDVPKQEVITKDNSPVEVDAVIYIRIMDPARAYFQVKRYKLATINLSQTMLRSVIGDMELDHILSQREKINTSLRDSLDEETDKWGVKVENVEIREVDPVRRVKAAMEEQTSAERERRAAILRAEGQKRSAILVAEGDKMSRILAAEGTKQSEILQAEGARISQILFAQGQAQALRALTLGAATLDSKALSVLSLDTVKALGEGQATKIVLPFELTSLVKSISKYASGASEQVPAVAISDIRELEKVLGPAENILGYIPKAEDIQKQLKTIDKTLKDQSKESVEIARRGSSKKDIERLVRQKPQELEERYAEEADYPEGEHYGE